MSALAFAARLEEDRRLPFSRRKDLPRARMTDSVNRARRTPPSSRGHRVRGGEPLLRPDIFELLRYARSRGKVCNFVSNGALMTLDHARETVACGVDFFSISLDDEHLRNTRAKDVRSSPPARAIEMVLEARRAVGSLNPRINVSCVVEPGKPSTPRQVLELFGELGWDSLNFYPLHFYPASYKQKQEEFKAKLGDATGDYVLGKLIPDDAVPSAEQIDEMLGFLRGAMARRGVRVFRDANREFWHWWYGREPSRMARCPYLYNTIYIDGFGNCSCCQTHIMGNLRETSIRKLWNGEKAVKLRLSRREGPHPMCFRCH